MNYMTDHPVLTTGVASGILIAAWAVVVDQGLLDAMTDAAQLSMTALVLLLIPVIASYLVQRLVTPVASPVLPVGTVVNERSDDPTSVVTEVEAPDDKAS